MGSLFFSSGVAVVDVVDGTGPRGASSQSADRRWMLGIALDELLGYWGRMGRDCVVVDDLSSYGQVKRTRYTIITLHLPTRPPTQTNIACHDN